MSAKQAAAEIGVKPVSLADLRRQAAQADAGGSPAAKATGIRPAARGFAEAFGLDGDEFEAKLKERLGG